MKKFFRFLYTAYHLLLPSQNRTCRFAPTCSEYFLEATTKYGALKGSYLSLKRLTSCHPLSKRPLYDPV